MKGPLYLIFFLFLASCSDDAPTVASVKDTVINRDTIPRPSASGNKLAPVDLSPMDIVYFPVDYPVTKMSGKAPAQPLARVIYSRPHRQGRKIFGNLLKFGEPWRLGANEATEIEFFSNATIQGKSVARGRYVLYCIPEETQWTIRFNSNTFSWGLKQDANKDLYEFRIPSETLSHPLEHFSMTFEKSGNGANLLMGWDDRLARLPIVF